MRLGQLARTLNTTTTDIVQYLSQKQLVIKDHPNVKLPEETEQEVIHVFTKGTSSQVHDESLIDDPDNPEKKLPAPSKKEKAPNHDDSGQKIKMDRQEEISKEEVADKEEKEVEIIKAPKVELRGLKVIGKIDLPEPTPKEKPEVQIKEKPAEKLKGRNGHKKSMRSEEEKEKRRLKRKQAQLKRQQQEKEKRKEQERKERKKQKRQHYLKKINKPSATAKKAKSKLTAPAKESAQKRPKSLLARFWKWLNT